MAGTIKGPRRSSSSLNPPIHSRPEEPLTNSRFCHNRICKQITRPAVFTEGMPWAWVLSSFSPCFSRVAVHLSPRGQYRGNHSIIVCDSFLGQVYTGSNPLVSISRFCNYMTCSLISLLTLFIKGIFAGFQVLIRLH